MTTLHLGAENFEATVAEHDIVLVDFWAQPITAVRAVDVDKALAAGVTTQRRSA